MIRITKAQRIWLQKHVNVGGMLPRFQNRKTIVFVLRVRDLGWVSLRYRKDSLGFPYFDFSRITAAGRQALVSGVQRRYGP